MYLARDLSHHWQLLTAITECRHGYPIAPWQDLCSDGTRNANTMTSREVALLLNSGDCTVSTAADLHGWYADREEEGHSQVHPTLPPPPQPCVDKAITFGGLAKAGCPKNTYSAVHHTCHPCTSTWASWRQFLNIECSSFCTIIPHSLAVILSSLRSPELSVSRVPVGLTCAIDLPCDCDSTFWRNKPACPVNLPRGVLDLSL